MASVSGTIPSSITKVTTSLGVMWRGTNGADTITVSGTDKLWTFVEGGAGKDTVAFSTGAFGRYNITKNKDGSVDVRDTHATGTVTHLNGVEVLKFGDTVYDVASAKVIAAAPAAPSVVTKVISAAGVAITGTKNADTIEVSGIGKAATRIDGGAGSDTVAFSGGAFDWYKLTKNADGTITVKDIHATGATTTLANVEKLKFGAIVYDVASGKVSGPAASAPSVVTTVTTPSGVTITGTNGGDSISIAGTGKVFTSINGGAGADTVAFTGGKAGWYTITRNADGSVDVKDGYATGTVTHLTNVETLQFTNARYDVATGVTTATTPVSPGSPSPGSSPEAPAPSKPVDSSAGVYSGGDNIVDVAMVNSSTSARPAGFWTFGQVFKQGDLPAGGELDAMINGQRVALQVDVKNTWDDGSVKHAVLTVKTPALAAGASATVELVRDSTPEGAGPALTVSQMLAGDLNLKLELSNLNGTNVVLDAKTVLAQAVSAGTVKTWLAGENAIEVAVRARINDQLEAEFDIRYHADGTYTTDVIVRNDWAFTAGVTQVTYDVAIKDHGTTVFSEAGVKHNQHATWHNVSTAAPGLSQLYGKFDAQYLADSKATAAYDLSVAPSEATLAAAYTAFLKTNTGLMGSAGVMQSIGTTGERPDIGPLPEWTVQYLRTMDVRAAESMFAKADASGAVPWHYRDNATGDPVQIDDHPTLWLDERASLKSIYQASASSTSTEGTGWTMDKSHQPSLTYLPYMVTGSQYYLEETQAEASWLIAAMWPDTRFGAEGLVTGTGQLRGQAWALRDLSNLLYAMPDDDPSRSYYEGILQNNLDSYVKSYITDRSKAIYGELEGFFDVPMGSREVGAISPWQENYMIMILGQLADRGYEQAVQLLNWSANFSAGRFLQAEEGFNPWYGAGYRLQIADPVTGRPLTTWEEAAAYTKIYINGGAELTSIGNVDSGSAYVASSLAATAVLAKIGNLDGMEAYGYLVEQAPGLFSSGFLKNGKYDFAFRPGADAQDIAAADHKVGTTAADALTGSERGDVLVGGSGNDTIAGGAGGDALYGGVGNDSIAGGTGNDVLFGGAGADTINGNAGNDIIRGGSGADSLRGEAGADVFVFGPGDGADVLFDFAAGRAGTDVIDLSDFVDAGRLVERDGSAGLGLGDLFFDPAGAATPYFTIVNGAYMLDFGQGDTILFKGLGMNTQFYADDFVF